MQTDPVLNANFLMVFDEAIQKAKQLEKNLLLSYTQSIEKCDPIQIFDKKPAEFETCFFWEKPSENIALIGIGAASIIETQGSERFDTTAKRWQNLLSDAVIYSTLADDPEQTLYYPYGPLLLGGFSFDPAHSDSPVWSDFPNSMMFLPYLLVSIGTNYATLTISQVIQPNIDKDKYIKKIAAHVQQLRVASLEGPYMSSDQDVAELIEQSNPRLPTADTWMDMVANTVLTLREGQYQKVVLSRGVQVTTASPTKLFDIPATLYQLQQNYPETYLFALQHQERCFCGATPEQLASVHNGNVQTMALAGTARQDSNANGADHPMNTALLSNRKDKKEHEFVVVMIRNFLETLCSEITISDTPHLLKLKNVQHLKTSIHGKLLPDRNILDVIAGLHPTPAVGGLPRAEALAAIRTREPTDRGWYAGPIGWLDAHGDGEFSVALRSALVDKNSALLFAGCGIVADSIPEKEYEESCWKLQAMRQNLCVQKNKQSDI